MLYAIKIPLDLSETKETQKKQKSKNKTPASLGYSPAHSRCFFLFHKNESNAISNWLSLPRIPFLQWSFNLQPVWLLIKLCNLKEKEQKPEVWLERGVHLSVDTFQILAPGNGSWSIRRDGPWGLLLEKQKALWWTLGHPRTCVQYALVKRY